MSDKALKEPDHLRQKLLKSKLGSVLGWKAPKIKSTVGPFEPAVFQRYQQACAELSATCNTWLSELDDATVELFVSGNARGNDAWRQWSDFQYEPIRQLQRNSPVWYAGGLGHPDHAADVVHWAKMPHFTIHEITCLSAGIEPGSFKPDDLARPSKADEHLRPTSLTYLLRQRDLIARKFDPYDHGEDVTPQKYLLWAERVQFEAFPEFVRLLRQYHLSETRLEIASPPVREPDKREIDSVAMLFTALAMDHLGYSPEERRSPATKEVTALCASFGFPISNDTVRKYLKIGASFLPKDWQRE